MKTVKARVRPHQAKSLYYYRMNYKQQHGADSPIRRLNDSHTQNKLFTLPKKQAKYSDYFDKMNNSRAEAVNASRTSCSDFMTTIEGYAKIQSLVDKIRKSFDNGNICDMFAEVPKLTSSPDTLLTLPNPIKTNLQSIHTFFNPKPKPYPKNDQLNTYNLDEYADRLGSLYTPSPSIQKQQEIKLLETKPQEIIKEIGAETVATYNPIESKIELLLSEIRYEKRRKEDCEFYVEAMEIKLNEYIDYVLGDDERYLGLSLQDKAQEILTHLHEHSGKILENWLKIVLIEIFFIQFKELQHHRLYHLQQQYKRNQKQEVRSQFDSKSNISSNKKIQYSEPNSKRSRIRQQDWIVRLP